MGKREGAGGRIKEEWSLDTIQGDYKPSLNVLASSFFCSHVSETDFNWVMFWTLIYPRTLLHNTLLIYLCVSKFFKTLQELRSKLFSYAGSRSWIKSSFAFTNKKFLQFSVTKAPVSVNILWGVCFYTNYFMWMLRQKFCDY